MNSIVSTASINSKYTPWSVDPSNAWMSSHIADGNYTDENIVDPYREYLEMDVAHLYIPRLAEELAKQCSTLCDKHY